jgi:5-(carboxyamino)imidazole ribonucleotide synthase
MPTSRRLEPGGTIGILGGGQLGRMLALAAARLGLKAHVYSDEDDVPAFDCAALRTVGAYEDRAAIEAFAMSVDVVTYEFENVPVATARAAERYAPVRPRPRALEVSQDRLAEKQFISGLGFPVAPFRAIETADQLEALLSGPRAPSGILKTRRFGYDGKGQVRIAPGEDCDKALSAIGRAASVFEEFVTFDCEVSVLAVRGLTGKPRFYDMPRNSHEDGILRRSVVPAGLPSAVAARGQAIAGRIAEAIDYVGVLAVEMFYVGPDAAEPLVVNEIAPRVHNSGHWTIEACAVSQFENHVRAVAGWPLGSVERHSNAVMLNLIGEEVGRWQELAADPGAALHLYGKGEARPGRKMGHVTRLSPKA